MRKITLLCSAGMSTSILVNKMKEAAEKQNYVCEINAYSLSSIDDVVPTSDIVLLGPQVRFYLQDLKEKHPSIPVEVIDMALYGAMDGETLVTNVRKILKDEK